jgi:hypothetical protein
MRVTHLEKRKDYSMKATVHSAKTPHHRPCLGQGFLLIPLLLACFGLAPIARAVGPDTEGAIPGPNNGEGIGVLVNRTTGVWNTGTGFEALNHLTSGNQNTATGLRALSSDTNGGFNTATGVFSLFSNTSGFFNSATGAYSLAHNTDGGCNTANGYSALYFNTEGYSNTANGYAALYRNMTGGSNTANGLQALFNNTTGFSNTASGNNALASNTMGSDNTATGSTALYNNTTGSFNTAAGEQALYNNMTGAQNTATGLQALSGNITGHNNTANGYRAGINVTGSGNVCIGAGVFGDAGVNDTTWVRNVYTTVQPVVGTDPDTVTVDSSGRLGRGNISSRRYKHDIELMGKASEELFKLKPVRFRYREEFDSTQTLAFGLIAEEVAEVYPDLVGRNAEGQPESVRYEQINAMLLNEFLKEHRKVEAQQAMITQLKKEMEILAARLTEQDSKIQKVSAQIEVGKALPQTALNNL